MWKSNFLNQKVLAISKVKNSPFTFSKPAPEASPVLTLGISSKGQVRTSVHYTLVQRKHMIQFRVPYAIFGEFFA